jgi:polyphosphate:AMP phosphotransferase
MFEAAELGRSVSKREYDEREPALRGELLAAQVELRTAAFPVIVLFAGVDAAGKSELVNLLNEWMDPCWIVTHAFGQPSDEERERPPFWRYWRALPPRGRVGIFLSAWYSEPVLNRAYGRIRRAELDQELDRIRAFEEALADDGALILKFWMHLGRAQQKKRLRKLEKDPLSRWRVTKLEWKHWKMYDDFVAAAERTISKTSTGKAPWHIVEGSDERYRSLTVGSLLLDAIQKRLGVSWREQIGRTEGRSESAPARPALASAASSNPGLTILSGLDMTQKLSKARYQRDLERCQGQLNLSVREAREKGVATVLVFEGWDAAGKGGVIRRITGALDARSYQVIPIAAPTDEEKAHHYLWRFWRHLSRAGRVSLFDRSWYGRVLVERVEGFASESEWRRAYAEINDFEGQLVEHGIVLVKFWLHVTKDEQLRRFKERERVHYKRWKITAEDWRNREKWDAYEAAVNEMVERTSTRIAPWTLVEANEKYFARIKALKTVGDRLRAAL